MPDGATLIATSVYWVATGKLPTDDVKDNPKQQTKERPEWKGKKGR